MSKLVAFRTYERFRSALDSNNIDEYSLNFIVSTGLLYTHGILLSSVTFGAESDGGVPLIIAGTPKTLSLANHTHSTYLEKNADIDIGNYKIVSGTTDLLYLDNNGISIGNSSTSTYIKGPAYRDSYTILDTGNFSIKEKTRNGTPLNNVALFKYGSGDFQLDYVKRLNSVTTFDNLATYTCLGTTNVDQKLYGFITFYTSEGIINSPWAQLRINITNKALEFRTSNSTTWTNVVNPEIATNALNVAGLVSGPTVSNANQVWKCDSDGNPGWRNEFSPSYSDLKFLLTAGTDLMTYNSQATRTILAGTNIKFKHNNNVLTIKSTNTTYKLKLNNTTNGDSSNGVNLGSFYAPTSLGNDGQVLGTDGTALLWQTIEKDPLFTSTLTGIDLTTSWSDVDPLNNKLTNGSYVILITYASCLYTGTFSFILGGTIDDEIILHCSGTIDSVGGTERGRLFAKIGTTSGTTFLRLATSLSESSAILSIKYRKLI